MPYLKTCICKYIWLLPVVKYRQLYFTYSRVVHFTNYYTLSENLKLCPKLQFSEKSQWFFFYFETLISIRIWIFTPKIQIIHVKLAKLSKSHFFFCSKIQFRNFEFIWKLNFWTQFEILNSASRVVHFTDY